LHQGFCGIKSIGIEDCYIPCANLEVGDWIVPLANGEDTGPKSDRLVPRYDQEKWSIPMSSISLNNQENIDSIDRIIVKEIIRTTPNTCENIHFSFNLVENIPNNQHNIASSTFDDSSSDKKLHGG
jgi:hypothetical protein